MKTFESKSVEIFYPVDKTYKFLSDFNNFGNLMPPEITKWKSTPLSCSFTISGMADLTMQFDQCIENKLIRMKSFGNNPFEYIMEIPLKSNESYSIARIIFHADLNPMFASIATTPLTNFVNILVEKLKEKLEAL
jgi:hypothetical protein